MERSRRLDDDALAEEIELYGDLVVAATASDGTLPQSAIDRLLGLADEPADEGEADGATHPDGGAPGTAGAAGSGG